LKKILTDNGQLLGTYEDSEELKSGDIMFYGFKPKDEEKRRPKEKERLIRKAHRPEQPKVKLGLMCPSCHQARYFEVVNTVEDKKVRIPVIKEVDIDIFYVPTNKTFKEFSKILDSQDNIFEFLKKPINEIEKSEGIEFKKYKSLMKFSEDNMTIDSEIYCLNCDKANKPQLFANEYARPNTQFHILCEICGSEMQISADDKLNKEAKVQTVKCRNESCGFETDMEVKY
jgi:hypothetical protein